DGLSAALTADLTAPLAARVLAWRGVFTAALRLACDTFFTPPLPNALLFFTISDVSPSVLLHATYSPDKPHAGAPTWQPLPLPPPAQSRRKTLADPVGVRCFKR